MNIEELVISRLTTASVAGGRIYRDSIPQAPTFPAIAVRLLDDDAIQRDASTGLALLELARLELVVVDTAMASAIAAIDAAKAALDNWTGVLGGLRVTKSRAGARRESSDVDGDKLIRMQILQITITYTRD